MLRLEGLRVAYGARPVLTDLDVTVGRGRIHVVMGPSGVGKTTLLRAMTGLVPRAGTVTVDRHELRTADGTIDLAGAPPERWQQVRARHLGVIFQDAALALTPLRRVGSLVGEVARLRGGAAGQDAEAQRRSVRAALRWAGFADPDEVVTRRCFELSGGMAQRVGLALAVAGRPALLLADEPTSALDGLARAEFLARLREYAQEGGSVVVVTHDRYVADAVADGLVTLGPAGQLPTPMPGGRSAHPVPAAQRDPRPDAPAALDLVAARKSYPGSGPVLRGVDLRVGPGEIVGLAGRSGAGKSTLVRCVVGLEPLDGGRLRIAGHRPEEVGWRTVRRQVQLVPQDPRASLNPWRTAIQLVADPLDAHRIGPRRWRRERAEQLLAEVGLPDAAHARPGALSTGQCQRISIARALAVEPQLLVADEPVASLDTELRDDMLDLIRRLALEHGVATLVVSHDLSAIEALCDRLAVLDHGVIVEQLEVGRMRRDAVHPLTLSLLDCYPAASPPADRRYDPDRSEHHAAPPV
ncbi:ABC transporter ATP-binding protein [Nitriliruptor alkaliphilus]|uniref:ABC transporter ATP-binding protein n=1 Tax=Nitriliruptor alkaliphilus TaxID=427918 RepID=UPI0014702190|nr:ATP-binding cassette domain-containing protein [Nitriliruptor alkaliphilus]